jgi:rhodanese-related sulfurtransferase
MLNLASAPHSPQIGDMKQLLLFTFLVFGFAGTALAGDLTAPEAWAQAKAGKLILIDVRSPGEWRQTGIPKGAKAITIHDPGGMTAFVAKVKAAVGDDRSVRIGLICAAGIRSHRAQAMLRLAGFTNVDNVREGMMGRSADTPGWLRRSLPTQRWSPE